MKENKHSIQIGRESINDVSTKELEILRHFIQDFLAKEKDIPNAALSKDSELFPQRQILIYKDTFYDFFDRVFETEYTLFIGNDSISEIPGEELIKLYLTLQSFLTHSEHFVEGAAIPGELPDKGKKKEIYLGPYTPQELSIESEEKSPFINKRTWITDSILSPQNDYTLSTPKGSAFRISQEDLLTLCKGISNYLNIAVG